MSLRAVRSPLAPKMTMEQGSTALRSASNRQAMSSSRCSGVFTDATLAEAREDFNVLIVASGAGVGLGRTAGQNIVCFASAAQIFYAHSGRCGGIGRRARLKIWYS